MVPYKLELRHDPDGRIVEKVETVSGKPVTWKYEYDSKGRLTKAYLDDRLICQIDYDKEGRRTRDYLPATAGSSYRDYKYTMNDNRLMKAGSSLYTHDEKGFRSIWSNKGVYTLYKYSSDYRLLKMEVEDADKVFEFTHNENGQRAVKYLNETPVEAYEWHDFIRLAGYHDGHYQFEFAYQEDSRLPYAMRRNDGAVAYLFYDQVGSLRVVADTDGNVIKEVLYDPFGGIIEDTNPSLRFPIGFAGGLHDRDLGFVRFGWRDYDVNTGRWTAPDPIEEKGGDPDWYGYCLDDPVNMVDPMGLFGALVLAGEAAYVTAAPYVARLAPYARSVYGVVSKYGKQAYNTVALNAQSAWNVGKHGVESGLPPEGVGGLVAESIAKPALKGVIGQVKSLIEDGYGKTIDKNMKDQREAARQRMNEFDKIYNESKELQYSPVKGTKKKLGDNIEKEDDEAPSRINRQINQVNKKQKPKPNDATELNKAKRQAVTPNLDKSGSHQRSDSGGAFESKSTKNVTNSGWNISVEDMFGGLDRKQKNFERDFMRDTFKF